MIVAASDASISRAAANLRAGQVVAFPTETVYGLGADAQSDSAVRKIFDLKGRPSNNPLIVHIADISLITAAAELPDDSTLRARLSALSAFWPGPLSVILPKSARISKLVTCGLPTVAVRIPDHPVALQLLRAASIPIAAPSANISTGISPTTAAHVQESFQATAPLILDGGACRVGIESTVLSIIGPEVAILRPGAITREQLEAALHEAVALSPPASARESSDAKVALTSPGTMALHYAPRTPLCFRGELPESEWPAAVGLLTFRPPASMPPSAAHPNPRFKAISVLSPSGSLEEAAARLFSALRDLDKQALDMIVVDCVPSDGIGYAIMDRLQRARHF